MRCLVSWLRGLALDVSAGYDSRLPGKFCGEARSADVGRYFRALGVEPCEAPGYHWSGRKEALKLVGCP